MANRLNYDIIWNTHSQVGCHVKANFLAVFLLTVWQRNIPTYVYVYA